MTEWTFTPTEDQMHAEPGDVPVPYFEEARADWAPYYASEKTEAQARGEVSQALNRLGASGASFQSGYFTVAGMKRHGYNIRFYHRGVPCRIRVAGLPIKNKETSHKLERVRVQALLNVCDWLLAAVRAPVFAPGADALTPFMLVDEQRDLTIMDVTNSYIESGRLPHLPPPAE